MEEVDNKALVVATSDREDFISAGPFHLSVVDWDNENHRRSVAASLVAGVYILERDRQENRNAQHALAPLWWEFFNFRLIRHLVDDVDHSIFGAVYEYELKTSPQSNNSDKGIPHYIIAFRGTLTQKGSVTRDIELDLHLVQHGLHNTTRTRMAIQAVRDVVASSQNRNVWLAGHSLGAAMAILAGKEMAIMGTFLESFFFNPPFFSAPLESIKDERVKHGIRIAGSVITAGLAFAMSVKKPQQKSRSVETFSSLSSWVPNIYVHPGDHICSEYIGYFQHREKMEKLGVGAIEKLATQHSLGGLMMTAFGKQAEPSHLLPSACLTINMAHAIDLKKAHALQQWWKPESEVNFKTQAFLYS
ncbi:GDSL esterase/lipase At4g10955-like [Silene latifolia]|uniref:GDSL esterase/lipase At4g10955-like n=1 Tax=Silene latifolia TaxID=37657 RepID=UPI003D77A85D